MICAMKRERLTSPALLVGVAVWAASLALYLSTMAPTLSWGYKNIGVDGGELLAAAKTLGVPHPPGYPTYILLLKAFGTLVPIGDFAYRGNLLSGLLASGSVALLYFVVLRFCRYLRPEGPKLHWVAGAGLAAAVFATSPLFWSQAIIAEVYALNTFFAGALLAIASHLALPREDERTAPDPRPWMALFGLLLGLGLGNHLTLLAVAAPLALWLLTTPGWRVLVSPWPAVALILGLGVYAYLPLRAAQEPPVNWGNADTLDGMAWMLSGRVYQDYVFGVPSSIIPTRVVTWVELVFSQFNPLGIFMALIGAVPLWSRLRWFLVASLASIGVLTLYSIAYFTFDSEVLTIPSFMVFSVWVGVGFFWIVTTFDAWAQEAKEWLKPGILRAAARRSFPLLSVIAITAVPVTSVILNYGSQNLRGDRRAYEYASRVMEEIPDGSVLLSAEEDQLFSLWYMSFVEETERDVAPIGVPLLKFDWYWRNIADRFPDRFPAEVPKDIVQAVTRIVEHNDGVHKVFFTYLDPFAANAFELKDMGAAVDLYEARPKAAP